MAYGRLFPCYSPSASTQLEHGPCRQHKETLLCILLFLSWCLLCGTTSILSTSLGRLKTCKQPLGQQCFRSALGVPHSGGSGSESAGAGSAKAGAIWS